MLPRWIFVSLLGLATVAPVRPAAAQGVAAPPQSTAGKPAAADEALFPCELVDLVPYAGNPVFAATGRDTWDQKIRERGYVLHEEGQYHLWYTGYRGGHEDPKSLGYATSPDGLHWTRWPGNPIHSQGWVEDVCVVRLGDTYYMFSEGRDDIAHMLLSKDRIHWQEQGNLDIRYTTGKRLSPGPYGTPTAWHEGDTWYLFYERRDQAVWLATSRDAKVWTNVQDDPVLVPGPDKYDSHFIALDQVLKYKGRYYGFYHALAERGSNNWTTCVATSTDLIHWIKYPRNPIIDGNKSSSVVVDLGPDLRLFTAHPDVCVFSPRPRKSGGARDDRLNRQER